MSIEIAAPRRTGAATTAVVTGAAGFIGSHLAIALLEQGVRVVGIDSFDHFYARSVKEANVARIADVASVAEPILGDRAFRCEEVDIVDGTAIERAVREAAPSVIYHLAALAGVQPSLADPARYVSVNLDGTTHVLEAARMAGCRRVVYASSSSVYGNSARVPFTEDDRADEPISPYAATKRGGELIASVYANTFGFRIACLRFFTVFGPVQRPDLAIASFMRRMATGEEITLFGDGTSSRDYTYVDDIVDGTISAGAWTEDAAPACRAFNLGGSHPVTLNELVDAVAATVGCVPRLRRTPGRPGDVERTWADLTRSAAELGYAPKVTLREGLVRQWESIQRELSLTRSSR